MHRPAFSRPKGALLVLCIVLLATCGFLFVNHGLLRARVALADDQIQIFDQVRGQAMRAGPAEAVGHLEYVLHYDPSGSRLPEGSRLDRIVEHARESAVRDILSDLRTRTGEDLGSDPAAWINKFSAETK